MKIGVAWSLWGRNALYVGQERVVTKIISKIVTLKLSDGFA